MEGQNNRTTYEKRLGRSSLQVRRWILHDLPSISGCQRQSAVNLQIKHIMVAAFAVRKTAEIATEILKVWPLLRVRKGVERQEDFAGAGGLPKAICEPCRYRSIDQSCVTVRDRRNDSRPDPLQLLPRHHHAQMQRRFVERERRCVDLGTQFGSVSRCRKQPDFRPSMLCSTVRPNLRGKLR